MKSQTIAAVTGAAMLALLFGFSAHAQTCAQATVTIQPRSPEGRAVPGLHYELYEQGTDIDGQAVGVRRVTGSTIDVAGRGVAKVTINRSAANPGAYALKLYDRSSTNGALWYYGQIQVSCGDAVTVEPSLSSIGIIVRDAAQQVLRDTPFALYVQETGADGSAALVSGNQIVSTTTGGGGETVIYVASGQTAARGQSSRYILAVRPKSGGEFRRTNIAVNPGQKTAVNYTLGQLDFAVRDIARQTYPEKTRVDFYEQLSTAEQAGKLVKTITLDREGKGVFVYPPGTYVAKVTGKSIPFYFYNVTVPSEAGRQMTFDTTENLQTQVTCSTTSEITVVAKGPGGEVVPNLKVDLLEQNAAAVGGTLGSTVLASGTTDRSGRAVLKAKVTEFRPYSIRAATTGVTVGQYFQSGLTLKCGEKREVALTMSLLRVKLLDIDGTPIVGEEFRIYGQNTTGNIYTKNEDYVGIYKTDNAGFARVFLSNGWYIFSYKNRAGTEFLAYNVEVPFDTTKDFTFIPPVAVLKVLATSGDPVASGTPVDIYEQRGEQQALYLGRKLATVHTDGNGNAAFQYPSGVYAAVVRLSDGKQSIHWNIVVAEGTQNFKELVVSGAAARPATSTGQVQAPAATQATGLIGRLAGRILLRVQARGEAYYVSGKNQARYYMKDGAAAYELMRRLGLGITNADLAKIPVGVIDDGLPDADGDGLSDALERALHTQPNNPDTDSDGYSDGVEISLNYSPFGPSKLSIDQSLVNRVSGQILLQVEDNGEAWYVYPVDGKRYYLANGEAAYQIMRELGLGITEADIAKITERSL